MIATDKMNGIVGRVWLFSACLAYDNIRLDGVAVVVPQAGAQVVVALQQPVEHLEQVLTVITRVVQIARFSNARPDGLLCRHL